LPSIPNWLDLEAVTNAMSCRSNCTCTSCASELLLKLSTNFILSYLYIKKHQALRPPDAISVIYISNGIINPDSNKINAPPNLEEICANGISSILFDAESTATSPVPPMFAIHKPAVIADSIG